MCQQLNNRFGTKWMFLSTWKTVHLSQRNLFHILLLRTKNASFFLMPCVAKIYTGSEGILVVGWYSLLTTNSHRKIYLFLVQLDKNDLVSQIQACVEKIDVILKFGKQQRKHLTQDGQAAWHKIHAVFPLFVERILSGEFARAFDLIKLYYLKISEQKKSGFPDSTGRTKFNYSLKFSSV